MRFINAELKALDRPPLPSSRTIDTVALAREAFPGAPASLNALCKRFNIDNSSRSLHGALLDAQLLAEVYLELIGGRQADMGLDGNGDRPGAAAANVAKLLSPQSTAGDAPPGGFAMRVAARRVFNLGRHGYIAVCMLSLGHAAHAYNGVAPYHITLHHITVMSDLGRHGSPCSCFLWDIVSRV